MATLITLASAAVAHARPSFVIAESSARAGDAVHFSISDAWGWGVAYHVEIDGEDVLDGRGGDVVAGTFTMPDLGEGARTVFVEAEIWWSDNERDFERRLEYLGPALRAPDPPAPAPGSPVPATGPQTAPPPKPASSPKGAGPSPAATPQSHRRPRQTRERHSTQTKQSVVGKRAHRGRDRRKSDRAKDRRSRRARRKARLFHGIPAQLAGDRPGDLEGFLALNAIVPPTAAVAAKSAPGAGGAALAVPALLGAAALTLAGTALLRKRRLASRSGRS